MVFVLDSSDQGLDLSEDRSRIASINKLGELRGSRGLQNGIDLFHRLHLVAYHIIFEVFIWTIGVVLELLLPWDLEPLIREVALTVLGSVKVLELLDLLGEEPVVLLLVHIL